MGNYQQSDSLSTVTDLPFSGTGYGIVEARAADSDYTAWRWEVVLATVPGVSIPDRTEVTGQSWLTIGHDGRGGAGAHLIWTADWQTGQTSPGKSLQVYLNPAVYTPGGAWASFFDAPADALAGVSSGNYQGLPIDPTTFASSSSEISTVTSWINSAADRFDKMHTDATSGSIVGFQGSLANAVGDLLASLHTVMVGLHDQMTYPTSYSDSIAAAGNSATTFLTDILSAHSSWAQLIEHSPLGAVVKVLEGIATLDANGNYVIADPQNTSFGDLTVDGSWTAVEQQAKDLWTGTLTGSENFSGLDLLGRTALNKLVTQFGVTANTIVPVTAPGKPPPAPNSGNDNPNSNPNQVDLNQTPGSGQNGPNNVLLSGGPGNQGPTNVPHPNPSADLALPGTGNPHNGQVDLSGGPGTVDPGLSHQANLTVAGGPGPMPVSLIATGPVGPALNGTSGPAPALGRLDNLAASPGVTGSLPGTGATPPVGFTGTIGSPRVGDLGAPERNSHAQRDKKVLAATPTAPSAGFSLGSDPAGAVLKRSAVPIFATRPPAVTSGLVNLQPIPGQGGPALALPSSPDIALGANAPAVGEVMPTPVTDGGVIGRGMFTAGEPGGPDGLGATGEAGPMPMGAGRGGGGLGRPERERLAYLPEEAEYWGTRPELATSSLQATARQTSDEPDFEPRESRLRAIGAEPEFTQSKHAITDRRKR